MTLLIRLFRLCLSGLLLGLITVEAAYGQSPLLGPLGFDNCSAFTAIDQAADGRFYLSTSGSSGNCHVLTSSEDRLRTRSIKLISDSLRQNAGYPYTNTLGVAATDSGCAVLTTTRTGFLVVRIGLDEQVLWARRYPLVMEDRYKAVNAVTIRANAAREFLVSTESGLVKLARDGTVQWARSFSGYGRLSNIAPCRDGSWLATGFTTSLYVARLSAAGDLVWQRGVGLNDGYIMGQGITELANGDVAVAGSCDLRAGNSKTDEGCLFRFTGAGKLLWSVKSRSGLTGFQNVTESRQGDLAVSFTDIGSGFNYRPHTGLAVFSGAGIHREANTFWSDSLNSTMPAMRRPILTDRLGYRHWVGSYSGYAPGGAWRTFLPNSLASCQASNFYLRTTPVGPVQLNVAQPNLLENTQASSAPFVVGVEAAGLPCPPIGCNNRRGSLPLLGADRYICLGADTTIVLDGSAYGGPYAWSTGAATPTLAVRQPGRYWVIAQTPCGTLSDTVEVLPLDSVTKTTLLAPSPLPRCTGDVIQLSAVGPPPFRWSDGVEGSPRYVEAAGSYWVQGTGTSRCRVLPSDTVPIRLNPAPMANAGPDLFICPTDSVALGDPAQPGIRYRWANREGTVSSTQAQLSVAGLAPRFEGPYLLAYAFGLTATSDSGCQAEDSVQVTVYPYNARWSDGTVHCQVEPPLLPNLISPNGDKLNDLFHIPGLERLGGGKLDIYDRWGAPVYTQPAYRNDWDAAGLAAGIYFYRLQVPAPGWDLKGWVEVVR